MDWFATALNEMSAASAPVWVAFITLVGTIVTAGGLIIKERVSKKTAPHPAADLSMAATLDSQAVMAVAAAIEAHALVQRESNRISDEHNDALTEHDNLLREMMNVLKRFSGEVEELRREIRVHGDALRAHSDALRSK